MKDKVELKLNKKNLKNLTLDDNVIPRHMTNSVHGASAGPELIVTTSLGHEGQNEPPQG
jgi:hypothetical protein